MIVNKVLLIIPIKHLIDPYSTFKLLNEEANGLKILGVVKNYFNIKRTNDNYLKKSFIIHQNKLILINNFDFEERYLVNRYKSVELPNLFVFNTASKLKTTMLQNSYRFPGNYLIELQTFKNFLLVFSYNEQYNIIVRLTYIKHINFNFLKD